MAYNGKMRINRFLAACGLGSRRAAEALVAAGRVRVNGEPVAALATYVEPRTDRVTVDGRRVAPPVTDTTYLLHKPEGVVTTAKDPQGRSTVLDFVPAVPRVFPVGRLDQESSGALLLTSDGDLAHRLLHPRYHVEKEYQVTAEGILEPGTVAALERGITLEGERRPTAPAAVHVTGTGSGRTRLTMIIREGRKRQIRRMLESVGHPVLQLHRVRIGPVGLGNLPAGAFRELTEAEMAALRRHLDAARPRRAPRPRPRSRSRKEGSHS
jgi:23S rRNA pseudouridine2605 synthase